MGVKGGGGAPMGSGGGKFERLGGGGSSGWQCITEEFISTLDE